MKPYSIVWALVAVLLSMSVAAVGNEQFVPVGGFIDVHQYDDQIVNPYDIGPFFPEPYPPLINPTPQPYFSRDLAVDLFRFEAPSGTQVGDYVTFIGTIKNNGMIAAPLNYAFFFNGENLGPAVPQELNRFWDGVVTFLNPGETRMVVKSIQLTHEGDNSIQLKADPFNFIKESRETNNSRSIRIVAQPAEQPPQNNPPVDNQNNQNNEPPANNQQNNPPANNNPPQDSNPPPSNSNNQNNVSRADARDALEEAQQRCEVDAKAVLERAQRAVAASESVPFTKRELEREEDNFRDARREVRDADRAYDRNDYTESFTKADSAEQKCDRLVRKLRINEPAQQPAESTPSYTVRYQQPARAPAPAAELEEDVQLIKSNVQKLVNEQPVVEDDAAASWLIFGVIVGSFLVLGELSALAYFVFRK